MTRLSLDSNSSATSGLPVHIGLRTAGCVRMIVSDNEQVGTVMNAQESSDPSQRIGARRHDDRSGGDELLTPRQVAALFQVNPKTVARWAQAGRIGSTTTVGGHRRYRRTEILSLLRDLSEPGRAPSSIDAFTGRR